MDPSACLGFRHTLHTVHAAFIFKARVSTVTFNHKADFFVSAKLGFTGVDYFHMPAAALGVKSIHSCKHACKQRGFISACAAANFHNNVFGIVRVAR